MQHRRQSRLDSLHSKLCSKQDAIQIDNHHATTPSNIINNDNNIMIPPAPFPQNLHRPRRQNKQRLLLPARQILIPIGPISRLLRQRHSR